MVRKDHRTTTLLSAFFAAGLLLAFFSLFVSRGALTSSYYSHYLFPTFPSSNQTLYLLSSSSSSSSLSTPPPSTSLLPPPPFPVSHTSSVLLPDWVVLTIFPPGTNSSILPCDAREQHKYYSCLFQNNSTSPALHSGTLPFSNSTIFKCLLPRSVHRYRPFKMPILIPSPSEVNNISRIRFDAGSQPDIVRWEFLVYEAFSTPDDVVLFAKGVNNRHGIFHRPGTLRCLFFFPDESGNINAVRSKVTSSVQEVFRCLHPDLSTLASQGSSLVKVSLEVYVDEYNITRVPSVAHYIPWRRKIDINDATGEKSLLCASTMLHNVAKFLKEWVVYHSKLGVDRFTLYDNDSDDELSSVVEELVKDGYNVTTTFWVWPKTQEAGFSHSAIFAKQSCTWMMFIDVDEFVFSPSWKDSSNPSKDMLKSLLPSNNLGSNSRKIGQVMINCHDFGPSNQTSHPVRGVTQGYTCRRTGEERHKSIVLLEAINHSLLNVVHHFQLKEGYARKKVGVERAVVNHYKFQAWSEFKAKFKRRVSAYVVDWTQQMNPFSKDRTPGLGFSPVEPKGWAQKFCDVRDQRLQKLTRRWFGSDSDDGYKLAWQ